jgi:uncharacterized membrane protein
MKYQSNYMRLVTKLSKVKTKLMFQNFLIFYGIFFVIIGFLNFITKLKLSPQSLYFMCAGTMFFLSGFVWKRSTKKDKDYQKIQKEEEEFYHRISQN